MDWVEELEWNRVEEREWNRSKRGTGTGSKVDGGLSSFMRSICTTIIGSVCNSKKTSPNLKSSVFRIPTACPAAGIHQRHNFIHHRWWFLAIKRFSQFQRHATASWIQQRDFLDECGTFEGVTSGRLKFALCLGHTRP
jgi:hypothetical protein